MNTRLLLRIAALLILIHFAGHLIGHFAWDTAEDPKMQEVVNTMKSYEGDFMGATRSMADYYEGYSWMIIVLFGMTVYLLWMLSGDVKTGSATVRKVLYAIAPAYIVFGIIEFMYFFPFAASMSFLAGVVMVIAIAKR